MQTDRKPYQDGDERPRGHSIAALLSAGLAEFFCIAAFVFLATVMVSNPAGNSTSQDVEALPIARHGLTLFCGVVAALYCAAATVTSGCHTADTARASGANSTELNPVTVVPGACFLSSTNLLNIALAFGLAIFVMVYASATFSGGHLNPAVSFALLLAGRISIVRFVVYLLCQLAGAIAGSALVLAIDPNGYRAALGAANRLNSWVSVGTALGVEIVLTAIFVFVIFAAVDKPRASVSAHLPTLAPYAIGVTLFLCHMIAIPIDGCSVNPARSFGTAVVSNTWQHHWIFWVGPLVGAGISGLMYEHLAYRSALYATPAEGHRRWFRRRGSNEDAKHVEHAGRRPAAEHEYIV